MIPSTCISSSVRAAISSPSQTVSRTRRGTSTRVGPGNELHQVRTKTSLCESRERWGLNSGAPGVVPIRWAHRVMPYGIYFDFQEAYPIAGCNPYTDFVALRESAPGTTLKFSPVQQLRQLSLVDLSWL